MKIIILTIVLTLFILSKVNSFIERSMGKNHIKSGKWIPVKYASMESNKMKRISENMAYPIKPANKTGPLKLQYYLPVHLKYTDQKYKYTIFNYDKITQLNVNQNILIVLGKWSGKWIIEDNHFRAMIYNNGESCWISSKNVRRKVHLFLLCSNEEKIDSVEEPNKCFYIIKLKTPLVCTNQTLFVYPHLSLKYKEQWNRLYTLLYYKLITKNYYNKQLENIFIESNLIEDKSNSEKQLSKNNTRVNNLDECIKGYKKLEKERDFLRNIIIKKYGWINDSKKISSPISYIIKSLHYF